jgi:hypothetical protein
MQTTKTSILNGFFPFFASDRTGNNVLTADDALETSRLFDEVILALGQDSHAWLVQIGTTDTGTDDDNYTLPANVIRLLAVFSDDRQLMREQDYCLPAEWRDQLGQPLAYTVEGKSDRILRFFPRPDRVATGKPFEDLHGAPTIIYTEQRTTGIPAQLHLPIALLTLSREFERETAHRDQDFSGICAALGANMLRMLHQMP